MVYKFFRGFYNLSSDLEKIENKQRPEDSEYIFISKFFGFQIICFSTMVLIPCFFMDKSESITNSKIFIEMFLTQGLWYASPYLNIFATKKLIRMKKEDKKLFSYEYLHYMLPFLFLSNHFFIYSYLERYYSFTVIKFDSYNILNWQLSQQMLIVVCLYIPFAYYFLNKIYRRYQIDTSLHINFLIMSITLFVTDMILKEVKVLFFPISDILLYITYFGTTFWIVFDWLKTLRRETFRTPTNEN